MKVLIVGAGASGIVASINYKRNHPQDDVLVIEHLDAPLKKLLATGNGRCNLGNSKLDVTRYSNSEFVKDILLGYDYEKFFDSISIKTKLIDELAYPMSESAVSVRNALLNEVKKLGIKINCEEELVDYKVGPKIEAATSKAKYEVDKLFLATALRSSPNLGSDGKILEILRKHNYQIKEPLPGLCPIETKQKPKLLDGVRAKCEVSLYENDEKIHQEKGEVLFKKNGLSGIVIFNTSRLIARSENKANKIVLDLLPDFTLEYIQKYCEKHTFNGFLQGFFNPKISQYLCERFSSPKEIVEATKHLEFDFEKFYDFEFSQVSVGGVKISEVNSNLESKREKGIYLIGELLDVDGPCGGYNLTFAFASALKASK